MDAAQIRRLKPELTRYLKRFDRCFARRDTRAHFPAYIEGQLSELPGKSCEPMALAVGMAPRTLQEFLAHYSWDEDRMRDKVQQIVLRDHAGPNSIGIVDETSDVKKGSKTPGVQRQWCGTVGKPENCIVTVHLGYATGDFHCLIDGDLYLPESWSNDRPRCRAAGIPDEVVYRPKWQIALELYDRVRDNGLTFDWLTVDEGYGSKPLFLQGLQQRKQLFVAEVPVTFSCWTRGPSITTRQYRRSNTGRPRKTPRLTVDSRSPSWVKNLLEHSSTLRDQVWVRYHVKDGAKGPLVWEAKQTRVTMKDDTGFPGMRLHLIVARNALDHDEVKYFVSNAPAATKIETLLLVAFSRWRVERCFQDHKQEIGLDQWEGRHYRGLKRHLILSCVSYLFLARVRDQLRGEKSRVDPLPSARRGCLAHAELVAQRTRLSHTHRACRQHNPPLATTQRHRPQVPPQAKTQVTAEKRHRAQTPETL